MKYIICISSLVLSILSSSVANAITFNFITNGLSNGAVDALNRAGQKWSQRLADPITVNLVVNMTNLNNSNVIGNASSTLLFGQYSTLRSAMINDAANEADDSVVAYLPNVNTASFFVPQGFSLSPNLLGTKANLKALGFAGLDNQFGINDGEINFNSGFNFDFDSSNGVGSGQMDFETVAAHEIGHILGFISVVDEIDFLVGNEPQEVMPYLLDMFRFGPLDNPTDLVEFTNASRDLRPGPESYFDDLTTEILFSTGDLGGDGHQASHWKADDITGNFLGIMDPTLSFTQISPITELDFRALDVIGYDIATVPLPGAFWLFGAGLLFLSGRKSTSGCN
jgi:hypothetical protein